jgi:hypothetical protein
MKHGRQGYEKHCRCDVCRSAKAKSARRYNVKYKHSTPEQLLSSDFPHGTENGYTRGCRCPECTKAYSSKRVKYGRKNPHYAREHNWNIKGVKICGRPFRYCDYEKMFDGQGQKCAICGKVLLKINGLRGKQSAAHVDHNHVTGEVRGLLCSMCNHLLGHATDNEEILMKAVAYLRTHFQEQTQIKEKKYK